MSQRWRLRVVRFDKAEEPGPPVFYGPNGKAVWEDEAVTFDTMRGARMAGTLYDQRNGWMYHTHAVEPVPRKEMSRR